MTTNHSNHPNPNIVQQHETSAGRQPAPVRGRVRRHRRLLAASASVVALGTFADSAPAGALLTGPVPPTTAVAGELAPVTEVGLDSVPGKLVSPLEEAETIPSIAEIAAQATPVAVPELGAPSLSVVETVDGPDGPETIVEPHVPGDDPSGEPEGDPMAPSPDDPGSADLQGSAARGSGTAATSSSQNGLWPGRYYKNPNRQIGRLFFDVRPGRGQVWSHCSATVVNAGNRSTIVTAGHCVYNPDPDSNGRVDGNGYWYEHLQFCPGYESGCKLGVWAYRGMWSTKSWVYGSNRAYAFHDDVAMVVLKPNRSGYVQNVVGSHGIAFNRAVGLQRYAFGYPAPDPDRWPQYKYSGEDLVWCSDVDTNDRRIRGTMWIDCTMTGGSSGGPWITSPNRSWLGYVNSVNSHKPYGGPYMSGPYFGTAEHRLFDYAKTR